MIKEEHPILKEQGTQRHKPGVLFSSLIKMGDDNNHIARSLEKQGTAYLKHLTHSGPQDMVAVINILLSGFICTIPHIQIRSWISWT